MTIMHHHPVILNSCPGGGCGVIGHEWVSVETCTWRELTGYDGFRVWHVKREYRWVGCMRDHMSILHVMVWQIACRK
jgi:hypothetical protein